MQILLIPADGAQPCRVLEADDAQHWYTAVTDLVGSPLSHGNYDRDAALWMHDDGLRLGLPVNERAISYVAGHSQAAARRPIAPGKVCFGVEERRNSSYRREGS